jgi:hypothetical protein
MIVPMLGRLHSKLERSLTNIAHVNVVNLSFEILGDENNQRAHTEQIHL